MDSEEWDDRKMNPSPIPYPDVNAIVFHLFTKVKAVLQEQHVGMYIHGSLANGGFDEASDIDVIFVTKEDLNEETCSKLSSMHTELSKMDSPWEIGRAHV